MALQAKDHTHLSNTKVGFWGPCPTVYWPGLSHGTLSQGVPYSSGGEEPGLWQFLGLFLKESKLRTAPPLVGPYPIWFLFYQVIYPLKEIYPDSGELGLLRCVLPIFPSLPDLGLTCALWERPQPRFWVSG